MLCSISVKKSARKSGVSPAAWATILRPDKVGEIGLCKGKIINKVCFYLHLLSSAWSLQGQICWIKGGHIKGKRAVGQGGLGRRLLPSVCIYNTPCVRNQWEDMNPTSWAVRVREMMIFSLLEREEITNVSMELQGLQGRSTALVRAKIWRQMCWLAGIFFF